MPPALPLGEVPVSRSWLPLRSSSFGIDPFAAIASLRDVTVPVSTQITRGQQEDTSSSALKAPERQLVVLGQQLQP